MTTTKIPIFLVELSPSYKGQVSLGRPMHLLDWPNVKQVIYFTMPTRRVSHLHKAEYLMSAKITRLHVCVCALDDTDTDVSMSEVRVRKEILSTILF